MRVAAHAVFMLQESFWFAKICYIFICDNNFLTKLLRLGNYVLLLLVLKFNSLTSSLSSPPVCLPLLYCGFSVLNSLKILKT